MKKFLSDVLIDCNLTVSGSSSLGAATGVTVDASDNSNKIATTAWVKSLGFATANTTYLLDVPANTTNFRLIGSDSSTDTITLSAAGASSITRVSASELRITSSDSIDYISGVSFASNTITFTGTGNAFSGTIDLSVYLTQAEGDSRYLQSYSETDTLDTVTSRDGVTTNTIGVGTVNVTGTTAGQELLTVDGTFGRLFTVTDDLSESLFSVNTVAGLPALEVFADNSIKLGAFASPITIDSDSNINIPGVITASGYNDANWNTAYNDRIVSAAVSGTSTKTLTLTQGDGGTVTASWTDLEGDQADGYVSTVALNGNSLDFTGTGSGFTGSVDLSTITSTFDLTEVETVYSTVRNVSGGLIQKGTPLAVVPGQTSGNLSDVVPAAADDPERMPAVFIANEDIANELEGQVVVFGEITGIDTSLYDSGTTVYVAPGGGWTDTKPTGTNLIQNLGIITKSHNSNGGGVVMGAGRSNDVPNIANGYAWVGNAQGVATPTQLGSNAFTSYTDHSTQGYLTSVAFGDLTSTPTTIGGYGITDAFDGAYSSLSGIPSTFTPSAHNHDDRYYTQTELDTEFNKYLRSDIPDSFNKLINSSQNITPEWGGGAINLKPSVGGGSTGIVFTSAQNINTDNGKDHGYLWWYDNNNNYSINPGSQENGAVVLGIMNDSVENGMGDSAVVESSGNIFLNPGIDPTEGSQGGNSGPNFTRGRVYVGRAAEFYEVYHEGNLNLGDYAAVNHVHDYDNYVSWNLKTNGTQRTTVQSGGTLDIVAGTNVSVSYGAGGVVTINSTDTNTDTNNYLTGLTFNTTNGVLTATRQGLANLTVDLDGRYLTGFTESDPVFAASPAGGIEAAMIDQWNEAYNYSTVGHLPLSGGTMSGTINMSGNALTNIYYLALGNYEKTNLPNGEGSIIYDLNDSDAPASLGDYGGSLPDGIYLRSSESKILTVYHTGHFTGTHISNWQTAYGWGNHASAGYLTTETLTELSVAGNILSYRDETGAVTEVDLSLYLDDTNLARLVTGTLDNGTGIATFTRSDDTTFDVDFSALFDDTNTYANSLAFSTSTGVLTVGRSGSLTDLTVDLDGRYLTSYTETDPIFTASAANSITAGQITNWDAAHAWGDHGAVGYLTSIPAEYVTATEMTNYSISPRFGSTIGMGNDSAIIEFQDSNSYTKAGYWTSRDGLLINGDSNSNNNIVLRTGNILVNQNQFISGKLGVNGRIELSDDAASALYQNGADGAGGGTIIESFDANANIGAFLDFTIYNDTKEHMRSGTLQLVFNLDQVMFNEVNTMDIGDTTPCTLVAVNNAGTVEVIFTTPDPTFHIKYHVRTL